MTRKSGVVRSTSEGMAASSVTSPTTSMSGWSATVVRISARISRGEIATRTRIDLPIARLKFWKYAGGSEVRAESKKYLGRSTGQGTQRMYQNIGTSTSIWLKVKLQEGFDFPFVAKQTFYSNALTIRLYFLLICIHCSGSSRNLTSL